MTLLDRIHELQRQRPELSLAAIARELGTTRQYVWRLLQPRGEPKRMGPPVKPRCTHCHGTGYEPTDATSSAARP